MAEIRASAIRLVTNKLLQTTMFCHPIEKFATKLLRSLEAKTVTVVAARQLLGQEMNSNQAANDSSIAAKDSHREEEPQAVDRG